MLLPASRLVPPGTSQNTCGGSIIAHSFVWFCARNVLNCLCGWFCRLATKKDGICEEPAEKGKLCCPPERFWLS
jgi:hypothetical protein